MTEKRAGAGKQAKAKSAGRRILPRVAAPADDLRRAVRDIVPAAFRDGQLQAEKLAQILQAPAEAQAPDRYRFEWAGKQDALRLFAAPPGGTLAPDPRRCRAPDPEKSAGAFASRNVYIEAENLEALKIIARAYAGRVGMIYIDPPYNTGNDFVYNDKFAVGSREYMARAGMLDRRGRASRAARDEVRRLNGHKHSAWLSMMFPRLMVARSLLADDGVIFVSIDDNEVHHLRLVMNEVFGEENFAGDIVWNSTRSHTGTALLSVSHTHNLVFFKQMDHFVENRREFRLPETGEGFSNPDKDPRGSWKADPFQVGGWRPNQQYAIVNPKTGVKYRPNEGNSWKNDFRKFRQLLDDGRIVFGVSGEAGPQRKRFLSEALERGRVANTIWDDVGTTAKATRDMAALFGKAVFDNPKPTALIRKFLLLGAPDKDAIVLDFFSGSATTAHAVMELNAEDGGKRRCVSIQLPEPTPENSPARKAGFRNIAEIGRERLIRAGEKIRESANGNMFAREVDTGFRFFRWSERPDNWPELKKSDEWGEQLRAQGKLTADAEPLFLLTDAMLRLGCPLCARIEEKTVNVCVSEEGDESETTPCRVFHVTAPDDSRGFHFCPEPSLPLRIGRALGLRRSDLLICREDAVDDRTAVTIVRRHRLMVV